MFPTVYETNVSYTSNVARWKCKKKKQKLLSEILHVCYRSRKDMIVKPHSLVAKETWLSRVKTHTAYSAMCVSASAESQYFPLLWCVSAGDNCCPPQVTSQSFPPPEAFALISSPSLNTASCSVTSRPFVTLTACIMAKQSTDVAAGIKLHIKNKPQWETAISCPFRPDKWNSISITISIYLYMPLKKKK